MKIINLYKKYDNSYDIYALNDINIDFDECGMTFILGKSGSGKTTLLNMIGGTDKPTSGEIEIDGFKLNELSNDELAKYRNSYIGFVFQEYNLLNELTVSENIELVLKTSGIEYDDNYLTDCFKLVELDYEEMKDKRNIDCSGGERQRVVILRALIKKPKIILCDEPTGALDSKTADSIMKLLRKLSEERLVLIVTHNEKLALEYGDRIIRISDGKIVDDQKVNEVNGKVVDCELKQSKADFKLLSKIGVENFKNHPIRLLITILLLIISFSFVMFSLNVSFINEKDACYDFIDKCDSSFMVSRKRLFEYDSYNNITNGNTDSVFVKLYNKKEDVYSKEEFEELSKLSGIQVSLYNHSTIILNRNHSFFDYDRLKADVSSGDYISASGFGLYDYGKDGELVTIHGRYPEKSGELMISMNTYEMFKRYGYNNNGNGIKINKFSDLIGRNVSVSIKHPDIVVVGVYDDSESDYEYDGDINFYNAFYDMNLLISDIENEYPFSYGFAFSDCEKLDEFSVIDGKRPEKQNELMISKNAFELFKRYGLNFGGVKVEINEFSDLIGKEIHVIYPDPVIVGIYDMSDIAYDFSDESNTDYAYYNSVLLNDDDFFYNYTEKQNQHMFFINSSKDDLKSIVDINQKNSNDEPDSYYKYSLIDVNLNSIDKIKDDVDLAKILSGLSLIVAVIFLIISISLLISSFSIYVANQIRQIGILDSLGIKRTQINVVYISIALIESLLIIILSTIFGFLTTYLVNDKILYDYYDILKFQPLSVIVSYLSILIVFFISVLFPLLKLKRMSSIEIINKGKKVLE